MVGDFEHRPFDPRVRDLTIQAVAAMLQARALSFKSIRFHKEDPRTTHKTCPGKNVVKSEFLARVNAELEDRGDHGLAQGETT